MNVSIQMKELRITVTDAEGKPVLDYGFENYRVECDVVKGVELAFAIRKLAMAKIEEVYEEEKHHDQV